MTANALPQIALIDDDPDWVETLADYLRRKGFQVQTANAAMQGLSLLERHTIPLALVDLHMPDMSGLELVRRVRQANLPVSVLLISSDDEPTLPQRALAEGAMGFIPKS